MSPTIGAYLPMNGNVDKFLLRLEINPQWVEEFILESSWDISDATIQHHL